MVPLAHNEFWAVVGPSGRAPDDSWFDHLYGNKKEASRTAKAYNRYHKRRPDPQAPYRVARVAIIEVFVDLDG